MFAFADKDKDGQLSYEEFEVGMQATIKETNRKIVGKQLLWN